MKIIWKLGFLTLLIALLSVTSCKNDFDVNGPLTEKLAVYGLVNYNDSAHYLKIYKTFITEDNVLVAAQNMDNYMMYDSIEVLLICYDETHGTSSYHYFDTTSIVPKDSGTFSNPSDPYKQVLYVNYDVLKPLDSCALQIKNKYTGKLMAESGCRFVYPSTYGNALDSADPFRVNTNYVTVANNSGVLLSSSTLQLKAPATNAYRYEAYYYFYYWEKENASDVDSTLMGPVKINIGTASTSGSSSQVNIQWNPTSFFTTLLSRLSSLSSTSEVIRRTGPIYLYIWAAGEDYSSYISNNSQVSLSIIEERPTITNITNGIGLFSSRYCFVKRDMKLSQMSVQALITNSTYSALHFKN